MCMHVHMYTMGTAYKWSKICVIFCGLTNNNHSSSMLNVWAIKEDCIHQAGTPSHGAQYGAKVCGQFAQLKSASLFSYVTK
jgi:hypothetical protein